MCCLASRTQWKNCQHFPLHLRHRLRLQAPHCRTEYRAEERAEFAAAWLIKEGRIRRSWIGVAGQNVPIHPRVVRHHRLPVSQAVLIVGVEPESPAVRTGLRVGDLLVAFKGEPIASIDQLQRCLVAAEIGVTSPLTVVRRTEKLELFVTPEEWEPSARRN